MEDPNALDTTIINCDRNGSTSELMTMVGDNFGDIDVIPILTLEGIAIPVKKSAKSPHTMLEFSLPPGFGSLLKLTLTVASQSAIAYVSYEPCPLGQDARCNLCGAGRCGGGGNSRSWGARG